MKYLYAIAGTAAGGQTWTVEGDVKVANDGEFNRVHALVMQEAFDRLTGGKAVFGKPGIGCRGPYAVTLLNIARADAVVVSGDAP